MAYRDKTKRLCLDAMLLGLSLLLSYIEAILPLAILIPLPGFKLGLCNILITAVFVGISPIDAAVISLARISLMGLLFGNAVSFAFSLCGGAFAYFGLFVLAKLGKKVFSMVGVSVGCAALHNIGQLTVTLLLFGSDVAFEYLPMLLLASVIFGCITGILLEILMPRLNSIKKL